MLKFLSLMFVILLFEFDYVLVYFINIIMINLFKLLKIVYIL